MFLKKSNIGLISCASKIEIVTHVMMSVKGCSVTKYVKKRIIFDQVFLAKASMQSTTQSVEYINILLKSNYF